MRALLNASISEADAFYNIVGQGYISLEEYHQIKRPILLDLLNKACAQSLECANALFKDRGKGIVTQIEYDSIRKPFILRQLCDLYGVDPKKADVFYRREAFSVVSKAEYDKIQAKFHVLARLKEICETNIRAADQFYADQTNKDVTLNEYLEIKDQLCLNN